MSSRVQMQFKGFGSAIPGSTILEVCHFLTLTLSLTFEMADPGMAGRYRFKNSDVTSSSIGAWWKQYISWSWKAQPELTSWLQYRVDDNDILRMAGEIYAEVFRHGSHLVDVESADRHSGGVCEVDRVLEERYRRRKRRIPSTRNDLPSELARGKSFTKISCLYK